MTFLGPGLEIAGDVDGLQFPRRDLGVVQEPEQVVAMIAGAFALEAIQMDDLGVPVADQVVRVDLRLTAQEIQASITGRLHRHFLCR